ncbi:hypothetical protein GCK32_009734 [Trichostrongylus colubriformis]|uniref:Uncharacterized protein n=1 Tax=Trichostrongylus colubriformis TaxID=6319 RepID=A0AAN8FP11_TRICO
MERISYCRNIYFSAQRPETKERKAITYECTFGLQAMFSSILEKITHQVRNLIHEKNNVLTSPIPRHRLTNLRDEEEQDSGRSSAFEYEKKVYKKSDPIDIIRPKATW